MTELTCTHCNANALTYHLLRTMIMCCAAVSFKIMRCRMHHKFHLNVPNPMTKCTAIEHSSKYQHTSTSQTTTYTQTLNTQHINTYPPTHTQIQCTNTHPITYTSNHNVV